MLVNQQIALQGNNCYILEETSPFSGPKILSVLFFWFFFCLSTILSTLIKHVTSLYNTSHS